MKKLAITAVAIAVTLGVSSYSKGKTTPVTAVTEKEQTSEIKMLQDADTISIIRMGRGNLAQAD